MDESFESLVCRLAVLRVERDQAKITMEQVVANAKLTDTYVWAVDAHNAAQVEIQSLEEKIRGWAVADYKATGSKKPHPALQIRVSKAIAYAADKAMEWCEKNLPVAIKRTVDTKLFEKTVQSLDALPDFVTVTEEPKATIATDLTPFLPEETELEKLGQDELPPF